MGAEGYLSACDNCETYIEEGSHFDVQIPVEQEDVNGKRWKRRENGKLPCFHRCGQNGDGW
jgi:hypothetical protein